MIKTLSSVFFGMFVYGLIVGHIAAAFISLFAAWFIVWCDKRLPTK